MVNEKLLRKTIKEKGIKYKYIAMKLGITYPGLINKVSNKSEFTVSEAYRIADILGIKGYPLESEIFLPNIDI